jgi:hypothetical protein
MTAEQFRLAQVDIQDAVRGRLTALMMVIPVFRSMRTRQLVAGETARIVSAGQLLAGGLALEYIASLVQFRRAPDLAAALGDRLMTDTSMGALTGLIRAWALEDQGYSPYAARQNAASFTSGLAAGDLQMASRIGGNEGAAAAGKKARYAKVAHDFGACDWCKAVAGGGDTFRYRDATTVPFHRDDKCGWDAEF